MTSLPFSRPWGENKTGAVWRRVWGALAATVVQDDAVIFELISKADQDLRSEILDSLVSITLVECYEGRRAGGIATHAA